MKEIKYRMWNKKEKKMYDVGVIDFDDKKAYMKSYLNYTVSNYMFEDIELMQFTGLHDKIGKEIYEGDKVYIIPEDNYGEIKWDSDMARFVVIYDDLITDFDNWYGYDLEVVGTIYD